MAVCDVCDAEETTTNPMECIGGQVYYCRYKEACSAAAQHMTLENPKTPCWCDMPRWDGTYNSSRESCRAARLAKEAAETPPAPLALSPYAADLLAYLRGLMEMQRKQADGGTDWPLARQLIDKMLQPTPYAAEGRSSDEILQLGGVAFQRLHRTP